MVATYIEGLTHSKISAGFSAAAEFEGHRIPKVFEAWFEFQDKVPRRRWNAYFEVSISKNGTPTLNEVRLLGSWDISTGYGKEYRDLNRDLNGIIPNPNFGKPSSNDDPEEIFLLNRGSVERWQIKFIEQYRFQLLELSIQMAITSTKDTLITNEDSEGRGDFRIWDESNNEFSEREIKAMSKVIGRRIRQKITPEFLLEVTEIYTKAALAGEPPTKAIQEKFKVSHRTASDYASKARKEGFLPDTEPGIVTVRKPSKKKGK